MRIAQVVSTFPPYRGGMGNMAFSYAQGLLRLGHDVEVFCPAPPGRMLEIETPFRVHRLRPWIRVRTSAVLPQLLGRLRGFDIVDLHYPFYGGAEIVGLAKGLKRDRLRLVVNFQMDNFGTGLLGLTYRLYAATLTPAILRSADRVIVTSFDYAAHSTAAGVLSRHREKFAEIPPGVDTDRFRPAEKSPALMARYGLRPDDRVALFVGGLDRAHAFKGIRFLIEAWRDIDVHRAKLLIVGQGDLRSSYQELAGRLGLGDQVLFADPVDDEGLPDHYRLADLLVLPSLDSSEAFGIVLIEAMACGVPAVTSKLPGPRRVVEPGETGFLFDVKDRAGLLAAMRAILEDPALKARMAAACRSMAVAKYAQEKIWAKLAGLYEEISRPAEVGDASGG